jgi:hypothetical protein
MATCAHCKTQETQLFQNGVPICLDCAGARTKPKPPATDQQIRATLLQDIIELAARNEQATEEFEAATGQIPSGLPHPDGVQRIKNASAKLATARQELMKAYRRLDEHIDRGIVPEDLKWSG